jgi:DNA-binding transcriptional LysR family regulator
VLEGVGYAVLPLWVLQVQLREGRLVRLCPSWRPPDITLSLAYAPSRGRSARVTALIDQIRSELQNDRGVGVEFLREAGALDSVRRLERRSRRS